MKLCELDKHIEEGALAAPYLDDIRGILDQDIFPEEQARLLQEYVNENLQGDEFYYVVHWLIGETKIISRWGFNRLMRWKGEPL